MFNRRCQICGNPFRRSRYKWNIRGKKAWVCPQCNATLERRVSSAAFGSEVDYPPIRKNGCGCGPLFLVALLGVVIVAGVKNLSTSKSEESPTVTESLPPTTARVEKPKAPATNPVPRVPLFHVVDQAIQTVFDLGLLNVSGEKSTWKHSERGWFSIAKKLDPIAESPNPKDSGTVITCIYNSTTEKQIEEVTWTIKQPSPSSTIPDEFKNICLSYCKNLGCQIPTGLFQGLDSDSAQQLKTYDATFTVTKLDPSVGNGWTLQIRENKNP